MKRKPSILVLLLAGLAALGFVLLRRHPSAPPPMVLHPTPQRLAQAQRHLEALQTEVLQPEIAPTVAVPSDPPPVRKRTAKQRRAPAVRQRVLRILKISEDDLNVYLAGSQSARKLLGTHGVQAVQVVLAEPANLTVHAAIALKGRKQNVQLDGALAPDPKTGLRFTATHAQVGRFPMPPAVVTAQANALASSLLIKVHGRLPLAIQSVQVQGKMLVLTGFLVRPNPTLQQRAASPQSVSQARHSSLPPASPPQTRPF